ncbi:MAG TPA: DUF480 domain-containing protein [Planctomycetaceae bacterium]|nr:DUF480 domain-containing protein [Planctomycetaceae bacterium]
MSDTGTEKIPLTPMSRKQRRVLGVLLEKAFTTPEQYPLTLKATTTGCNQKNNRDPVSSYDEDTVHQTLEELRERGFVGCLHTESGRTERYRHYLRHRTDLTEPQLAIITELLLRGPQQLGELRTRASRMVAIDSQEELRDALQTLAEKNLVRANGPLERRGIEVDHNLYPPGENHEPLAAYQDIAEPPADAEERPVRSVPVSRPESVPRDDARIATLETTIHDLQSQLADVRDLLGTLKDDFAELRRQIGG